MRKHDQRNPENAETLNLVDKVARAILKKRYYDRRPRAYDFDVEQLWWKLDPDYIIAAHEEAKAAIEAVREEISTFLKLDEESVGGGDAEQPRKTE